MEEADPCSQFSSSLATADHNTIGGMSVCGKGTLLHRSHCQQLHDGFQRHSGGISRSTFEGKSTSRMMCFPSILNEYHECLPVLNYMELCFEESEDQAVAH